MTYSPVMAALAQLPTYDPRALNMNTDPMLGQSAPADPMYTQDFQQPVSPWSNAQSDDGSPQGFNPNMIVGHDQPMNPSGYAYDGGNSQAQSMSPEQLSSARQMYEPGPAQRRYMEALTGEPAPVHGFGAHLLGALKGLAMGNIGGAVMGAVDPNMVNRAWHRTQAQAYAQPAQVEQQMQEQRLKQAAMIANATGVDPTTGLRTPAAEYKDYMAQIAAGNLANRQRGTDSLIDRRTSLTANQEKTARGHQLRGQLALLQASNAPLSPQDLERLRAEYPDYVFPQGFDATKNELKVDQFGNLISVPKSGGEARAVTQDGQPVGSFQGTQLKSREAEGAKNRDASASNSAANRAAASDRQAAQQAHSDAQKLVDGAKKTLDAAQAAANKAEGMFGASDAQKQAVVSAQAAYDAAVAHQKTAAVQQPAPSGALQNPNIGKIVYKMENGKRVRGVVKGIANGEYVIDWH